jgi:hypothetical protein
MGRGASSRQRRIAAVAMLALTACASTAAPAAVQTGTTSPPASTPPTPSSAAPTSAGTVARTAASTAASTAPASTRTSVPPTVHGGATTTAVPATIPNGTVVGAPTTAPVPATVAPPVTASGPFAPPVLSAGPCALTPYSGAATLTFVVGSKLYELGFGQTTAVCIHDGVTAGAVAPVWSPSGQSVLLDGSKVVDAKGATHDTGYLATNLGVSWSYPTGKALIAPSVANGALLWRTAGQPGTRLDVSFIAHTDLAAYHPAGKNIFAVGTSADGTKGIYVASNRGANVRTVATLDDPSTNITGLAPDAGGTQLYVLHDEHTKWDVHLIQFPSLLLTTLYSSDVPTSHLVIGTTPGSPVAVQVGDCASSATHTVVPQWSQDAIGAGTPLASASTSPIGFLDAHTVAVASRASGCSGPVDVWAVNQDGTAVQLLAAVDSVAVRSAVTDFGELPADINAQAPG